jgi:hypothetical protein
LITHNIKRGQSVTIVDQYPTTIIRKEFIVNGHSLCKPLLILFVLLLTLGPDASAGEIKNPYHKTTKWKLWSGDSANVKAGKKVIVPPSVNKRLYPDDSDTTKNPGQFLVYRNKDWPGRKYAGMWDDVYVSQDRKHSYIRREWCGKGGNSVKIRDCIIHMVMDKPVYLHRVGANFTS